MVDINTGCYSAQNSSLSDFFVECVKKLIMKRDLYRELIVSSILSMAFLYGIVHVLILLSNRVDFQSSQRNILLHKKASSTVGDIFHCYEKNNIIVENLC